MLQKRNRKDKKYLRYLGLLFVLLGISLVLAAAFIFLSPYVFKNPLISPIAQSLKGQSPDVKSILTKEKINVSEVSVATDSSYMVSLTDGGTVIMSSNKDLVEQARSLQIILSRLTIEGKRFKTLDFRFDKPVVAF